MDIKLIYGTDTGNTEVIKENLVRLLDGAALEPDNVTVVEVSDLDSDDWTSHTKYILGIPTWYDGELQSDWEDYFEEFKKIDFTGKTVAVFGLGDQIGYAEWFCDGVGILAQVVQQNGGKIIGNWPVDGYDFESSKAVMNTLNTFYGLCLDEDNQQELTQDRLKKWVLQIKKQFML